MVGLGAGLGAGLGGRAGRLNKLWKRCGSRVLLKAGTCGQLTLNFRQQ